MIEPNESFVSYHNARAEIRQAGIGTDDGQSGSAVFTGYQIKHATNANLTGNVKTIRITRPDRFQTVISGLKSGTTYYVTIRSYQVFEGMTYFGERSNVLSCKVK